LISCTIQFIFGLVYYLETSFNYYRFILRSGEMQKSRKT
jgi:hypothetical protein